MLIADRSWKRQEMDSPLEPPERTQPCWLLDFSLQVSRTVREYICHRKPTEFMAICDGSLRQRIHPASPFTKAHPGLWSVTTVPQESNVTVCVKIHNLKYSCTYNSISIVTMWNLQTVFPPAERVIPTCVCLTTFRFSLTSLFFVVFCFALW